jgi:aryl-alcohol dehydrogenase-like predicted oxidoreductase
MEQTRLGRSDLIVSRVAFGTWELSGDWGSTDETEAVAAIRRAADRGVTLFDTAQGYGFGTSERLLAKALQGRREDFVIATKGGLRPLPGGGVARDASPAWIRHGIEASLRTLGTDSLDLYQLHWPDPDTPFEETAAALAELVTAGKVRHIGVSNFDVGQIEAFGETLPVETLQPPYHLFGRSIETSVLPFARAHDIGVLVYGPMAHGILSGGLREDTQFASRDWRATSTDFQGDAYRRNLATAAELERLARSELGVTLSQLAVAWTLANPAIHAAIVGTRNPAHVDEAVEAAEIVLEPAVLDRINEIARQAQPIAGPSPEAMPEA